MTGKRIEAELSASRDLAWKYTAALEKKPADGEPPVALLRQALYNVRQHEVFLKKLLVGRPPRESFHSSTHCFFFSILSNAHF